MAALTTASLDWFGCATFRLTLPCPSKPSGKLVIWLDAYLDRIDEAEKPDPLLLPQDVTEADYILVGHSHFDHAYGAERIAKNTGATIIGSHETVRIMANEGVPESQMIPVAGGERIELAEGIFVSVLPSLHSCVWVAAGGFGKAADQECLGELGVPWHERQKRFGELMKYFGKLPPAVGKHVKDSDQKPKGDGGAYLYHIETPEGNILYQDTSGHWSGIMEKNIPKTDVALLAVAGRPNTNGEPLQGSMSQFTATQASYLGPSLKRVILNHHDDWLPGFTAPRFDVSVIAKEVAAKTSGRVETLELPYVSGYQLFAGLDKEKL